MGPFHQKSLVTILQQCKSLIHFCCKLYHEWLSGNCFLKWYCRVHDTVDLSFPEAISSDCGSDLSYNNLNGTIPSNFSGLPHLQKLWALFPLLFIMFVALEAGFLLNYFVISLPFRVNSSLQISIQYNYFIILFCCQVTSKQFIKRFCSINNLAK